MIKKALLILSSIFLLFNLIWIYANPISLDLFRISITGLAVSTSVIVIVISGLAFYLKNQNILGKFFSVVLIAALLVLVLSGTVFANMSSKSHNVLVVTELQANIPGTTGYSIFQLADGNFILNSANKSCTFLVKLDSDYREIWTKTIRIDQENTILSQLVPTNDGGFALAGIINNQYVLVKTDSQGNIQWTKMYDSGAPINYLRAMIQTRDGSFAIAGFGEPVEEGLGWIWFAKTDSSGNLQWNRNISGPVADCPSSIIEPFDGGYVLSDVSYSFEPDQGFFRLIRMNMHGTVLWNTTYGGEGYYREPECNFAIATKDGGYLLAGYLWDTDAWVVKTDAIGNMQWNQTYGRTGSSITGALETQNGDYLFASISNFHNAGLIMTDNAGNQLWNITFTNVTFPIGYEANFNTLINGENGDYLIIGSKNQSVWLSKLNYSNAPAILLLLSIISSVLVIAISVAFLVVLRKNSTTSLKNRQ